MTGEATDAMLVKQVKQSTTSRLDGADKTYTKLRHTHKCYKCTAPIVTHVMWIGERAYCSVGCYRERKPFEKSQFEKLYRALAQMSRSYN